MTSPETPPIHGRHDHERTDVRIGPILWFFLALGLVGVVVQLGAWRILRGFDRGAETSDQRSARPPAVETFSGPQLQAAPRQDLRDLRARQQRELTEYRWVDSSRGVVAIPIQRAMELLAEKGLNAAEAARPKEPATPSGKPTEKAGQDKDVNK